jgi:hypothetical protein
VFFVGTDILAFSVESSWDRGPAKDLSPRENLRDSQRNSRICLRSPKGTACKRGDSGWTTRNRFSFPKRVNVQDRTERHSLANRFKQAPDRGFKPGRDRLDRIRHAGPEGSVRGS